ncbi:MAG: nitroreductase family deazaflavin-dependent oxidoreductase [Gammaproteobacteria bacterium]|jgi:F420H(2)-dependent quinone reductase|nr:nitroreductase family deazaflavin-dependent oxidoreductase [Gammaproteobacteria bacterium]MBT5154440.1 nitroreductase family deazaflavin-dependent oxidoreductase [Gammaproteobacteria bacterium]MBT5684857.1 nitroreductase family deazaflavin-dependent oxidoreductase [Gammaproteobacteria bacterium]MBT5725912.1 nitroreductase family deazaflavin-dependent oxidoreductase [Gammaproteobacteria bacterium]MBT6584737.1 nitroreductase family deazaflavin-dependent oxidoreductase [Gammaproteobacteria bact
MADYIPPTLDWVRKQVEEYEASGGTRGTTLLDTGMPCIVVTHTGNQTGAIRKIPLMRVKVDKNYILVGSMGGQPKNPVWVYNLRANPSVEIRDETVVTAMTAREVTDEDERARLWKVCVEVFPPYGEYKAKTTRKIPVFVAEPG